MKKTYKLLLLLLSFICLFIVFRLEGSFPTLITSFNMDSAFSFSLENGFYAKDIQVALSLDSPHAEHFQIHYTQDGSLPDLSSPLYEKPLSFKSGKELQAITLKAVVSRNEKILGGPYTATYFVGNNAFSFTNALMVSITAEKEGLFSSETGILYPATDCGPTPEDWKWFETQNCKQRGDEWIRDAHVDIFEPDGSNVISQNIGLCVDGDHGSMTHYPYSLKILAGEEYDESAPAFAYDFFHYYNTRGTQFPHLQNFNNLVFRNGGNEYNAGVSDPAQRGTMLRWNIGSRLADEAGFLVAGARPALLFLNGEFYAATQLLDTYNYYNTGQRLELDKDYIELYKDSERSCTRQGGYEDLYYSYPDIENSPIFEKTEEFNETVSLDDMFLYYAFEVLVNNTDYPKKNYAIWRYLGAEDIANPYTDGKFRFFINDLDCIYDFRYDDDLWTAYFHNIKKDGTLMGSLMQVEEYRIHFLNILCDLMNSGLFSPEHLDTVINEANADFSLIGSSYYTPEDEAKRQQNVSFLKESAFFRLSEVYAFLKETFAPQYPYVLSVKAPAYGSLIHWSTWDMLPSDAAYAGTYYGDYPLTLSCKTNQYRQFSHWLVNGKKMDSEEITLDASLIQNGRIEIELVTKPKETEGLLISEVCADPKNTWIELYNPTASPITLSDYAFSNNVPKWLSFQLPNVVLKPGQIFLTGIDNNGRFQLETGKTIYLLSSSNNTVIDFFQVPNMAKTESYGRLGETDVFRYFATPTKGVPN